MTARTAATEPEVLPQQRWQQLQRIYQDQVDRLCAGHRDRARRGEPHPVEDFLFSYYTFRPAQLRRWHPGVGTVLAGEQARARLRWPHYTLIDRGDGDPVVGLDVAGFLARRGPAVQRIRHLLAATAERPALLGCFGLHEWAMAYRLPAEGTRHPAWPLRLGPAGTDTVVEAHRIRCTHHDAFRFFTPAARPHNAVQPTREDQVALEQPGCLHATMDLYKWAYKLAPAVPGELLLDCFRLARDVRVMDMRASPYDLRALGHEPVPIETAEGKAAYVEAQRDFILRARPLRSRLLEVCEALLAGPDPEGEPVQRRGSRWRSRP